MSKKRTGKLVVRLRLRRGKETYDKHGNLNSPNHEMDSPIYPSYEFDKFVKNLSMLYTGVDVLGVKELVNVSKQNPFEKEGVMIVTPTYEIFTDEEKVKELTELAGSSFRQEEKKELTPEQKQIAELKAMVEELKNAGKSKPKVEAPKEPATDDDLDDITELRDDYKMLHPEGKEADKRWKEPKLIKEIEKLKIAE